MFSIFNIESPGPEMAIIKDLQIHMEDNKQGGVWDAVQEFFAKGHMPKFVSATTLVALPKVSNPQHASEFKPISCCNVFYKCVVKLLSSRLEDVWPHLIH